MANTTLDKTTSNNNETKDLNIEHIRQLTNKKHADNKKYFEEAADEAFEYIVNGSEDKIYEAASTGRPLTYIYRWKYLKDPVDKTFCFKNVRIMDLLRKTDLLERLRKNFNPDSEQNGYKVGWKKFKKTEPTEYGIFVSWFPPREPTDEDAVNNDD